MQFAQGSSKIAKKVTPIREGSDKIRPGYFVPAGKKSRGGTKQSNIQMTGSLTLEDIRGHDAEIE